MTEKTPLREVSFRHRADVLRDPEFRAAAERSLYQALADLGIEPGVLEVRDEPARPADAFYAFNVPAMTVLTLRAKA